MKDTWFNMFLCQFEELELTTEEQNRFVVFASRRLGLKICKLWGEDYDKLRGEYLKGAVYE